MASKTESKKWDIKEAKKLFQEYLKRGLEEEKKEISFTLHPLPIRILQYSKAFQVLT